MKIGVYTHYFIPEIGAPSARIGDFAWQWHESGHDVHVATCFPNHPTGMIYPGYKVGRYMHEVMRGINVHRSWSYITANKGFLKKSLGHASFWSSARAVTRKISAPHCAIGSSPTFFAAMAARDKARRHRIPFIMEVRDLWPSIFVDLGVIKNRRVIRLLERWEMGLYHSAAKIVTVTESFRDNLISRGIPSRKVHTITNGADTDYWQPSWDKADRLRQQLGLKDAFVVLYIGAHGISQGLGAILDAAARVRDLSRVQFVFVGEGADKEKLATKAQQLGLTNVRFLSPVGKDVVRDYYTMADLCLVPLRDIPLFDTFIPSKMFEIMAVGRPILGSLRGEAAEILRRSGAAVVVAPEDDAAIASEIRTLASNNAALAEMAKKGPAFVKEHYSRSVLARRYIDVIAEARQEFGLPIS